jgi:hypothetical protein
MFRVCVSLPVSCEKRVYSFSTLNSAVEFRLEREAEGMLAWMMPAAKG